MSEHLLALARARRWKHDRLEDGEVVLPGKTGFIYRVAEGTLGWCCIDEPPYRVPRGTKIRALKELFFAVTLEGDAEFVALFSEDRLDEVASRWVRCRRLRPAGTADHLKAHRFSGPCLHEPHGELERPISPEADSVVATETQEVLAP
jgi:hypothetical protein